MEGALSAQALKLFRPTRNSYSLHRAHDAAPVAPETLLFKGARGGVIAAESIVLRQTGSGSIPGSADDAYNAIRASTTDVASIARSMGYKPSNIQKVKDHLFMDEHLLDRYESLGIPATRARFVDLKLELTGPLT